MMDILRWSVGWWFKCSVYVATPRERVLREGYAADAALLDFVLAPSALLDLDLLLVTIPLEEA